MTLNVKDTENPAAPAAPAAPTASAPKSPAEASARPQPVALEVPVTVNGARTVEGSDKREPFSEKSSTVLVFGHGAVIRISVMLAPGQLVFLTNEKTKKEVVCQVVKSKTDSNAVGYVELRFTEPAPGFWGMRFPSDTVIPQAASRPAAPAAAPATPKIAPAPPAPRVAAQPTVAVPPAAKPVISPAPVHVAPTSSPVAAAPEVHSTPTPSIVSSPQAVELKPSFPTPPPPATFESAPVPAHAEPPVAPPAIVQAPPAPVASAPVSPIIESKPVATITSAPAFSSDPSTEELKQQAARLQEQLSSLLFTEAPKPNTQVAVPPSTETVNAPEVAHKVFELASLAPEPAPAKPLKSVAPPQPKPAAASLEVEEIKIPSWLAPLAREAETQAPAANSFHVEGTNSDVESVIPPAPEEVVLAEAQESSRRPETAVFGGQLLGESSQASDAPASKSKTGLFIGIAASLLLVAGGVWYSHQPGNALSGMLSGGTSSAPRAASSPVAANSAVEPVPAPATAASAPAPAPSRVTPSAEPTPNPAPSAPVDPAPRNANPAPPAAARNVQPVVEEPKKPSLGNVYLGTPVINHGASASSSPADPALEINSSASGSEPVSTLAGSRGAGPAAPVPVGGDVKPAKLLKSVPPVYPDLARKQHVSGHVDIDAVIDADGNVSSMKVLSGSPLLHQAALNALKQWKYQPGELNGKPTSMHLTVTIQFREQ